ncbi:MAG: zinc transporter ZupT [Clostridiales bacterium]|nr:zinc transporter ZupT [Clostridiales bacterium]
MNNTAIAFLMTVIAGLATGIGSIIAFFAKSTNKTFLSVSLGFSAGVMIYVSMMEMMTNARDTLTLSFGALAGGWTAIAAFFGGIALMVVIDRLIPSPDDNQAALPIADMTSVSGMRRTGFMTALAIAIHNFPEGMATFVSALAGADVAVPIVVAIAIHNIPEGIAVSAPIYAATGSKKKAFILSFVSGLAEPVGALVGWLVLMPIMSDVALGIIFAAVAGIMVYISIEELLPSARKARDGSAVTYGAILGMAVMGISLMLFV